MPVNKKKMDAMKKEYGSKKWENIYFATEQKNKKKAKKNNTKTK